MVRTSTFFSRNTKYLGTITAAVISSFLCFVSRSRFCRLIGCNTRDGSTYCCTVYLVVTKGLLFSMYCLFSVLQGLLTRAKTSRRRAKTNRRLAKTNLRRACQDELMIMTRQDESKTCYRLVQIERQKLCPREFLTPFFRVRPRNFAHIFWTSLSKTRRGFFF